MNPTGSTGNLIGAETITSSAVVRHQGFLWRVDKHPTETDEQAKDRAWYIATQLPSEMALPEKECLSRKWSNEKYLKMSYNQ